MPNGANIYPHPFSISNNGIGIAAEYIDRVFEIFHKLHPGTDGIGLGLTIVNRLNGTIRVESQIGQGRTFTVSLPKS
jgi:signal transduction histidine kinase